MNTHATIEGLLEASFSMRSVSYRRKVGDCSSQNFLLLISQHCPGRTEEPQKAKQDSRFASLGTKPGPLESDGRNAGATIRYRVVRLCCFTVGSSRLRRFLALRHKPSIKATTRREMKPRPIQFGCMYN
jgi:hypothetical protein